MRFYRCPTHWLTFRCCCDPTTFSAPFATIAILEHKTSASNIICVVIITARSGVAKDDKRLQISFRVEGSNPVDADKNDISVHLIFSADDEMAEFLILTSRWFVKQQHARRSKQRNSN